MAAPASTSPVLAGEHVANLGAWATISDADGEVTKSELRRVIAALGGGLLTDAAFQVGVKRCPMNEDMPEEGRLLRIEQDGQTKYELDVFVDGRVSRLQELTRVDLDAVKGQCELRAFPAADAAKKMVLSVRENDGIALLNGEPLQLRWTYGEPNAASHTALCAYVDDDGKSYASRDRWLPLQAFDRGGLQAFLFARYAWGLNLHVALLDVATRTLYSSDSHNYDHPEGVAVRTAEVDGKTVVQMYLDNDGVTRRVLYSVAEPLLSFHNLYHNSGWVIWASAKGLEAEFRRIEAKAQSE